MIEIPPEWLQGEKFTTAEVAQMFGVGQVTVKRWVRDALIGFIVLPGGEYRYPGCEVRRMAACEPISEQTKEIAEHLNKVVLGRWATGEYRRSPFIKSNGPKEPEDADE